MVVGVSGVSGGSGGSGGSGVSGESMGVKLRYVFLINSVGSGDSRGNGVMRVVVGNRYCG